MLMVRAETFGSPPFLFHQFPKKKLSMNESGITVKLFMGISLPPDLKMQLEKNIQWKKYCIEEGNDTNRIRIIPHSQKDYLGCYFDGDRIHWSALALKSVQIRAALELFFPRVRVDKLTIVIFNQTLMAV